MSAGEWRKKVFVLVTPLLIAACRNLTVQEFRTLHAWFTCDECVNGERSAVAAIGPKAVAMLDSALIGPSRGRQALMRAKAQDGSRIARTTGQRTVQYVDARLANYVATYQKRAAVSLGDIGNERARNALDRAIAQSSARAYRPDVLRVIKFVRSTASLPRFNGTITPARVAFGDVVTVTPAAGHHFSGITGAALRNSPFPRNQVPFRRAADTLQFLALADQGYHALAVTNAGDTAVAPLLINSILDPNDRGMTMCADTNTACVTARAASIPVAHVMSTQPFLAFLALQRLRNPMDTLDFFKIQPIGADSLKLTAELDWHGPADLDLLWRRCSTFVSVGTANGATAAMPETTSVTIPPGQCWILRVGMAAGSGAGPAFARLRVRRR